MEQAKHDGQAIVAEAESKAEAIVAELNSKAEAINTESENLKLANDKELHKRFPGKIIKVERPVTKINQRYVESVTFGQTVDIRMVNKRSVSITPKFENTPDRSVRILDR